MLIEPSLTPAPGELEACTSAEHYDDNSVRVSSIWGDVCFVSSWHLVHEKQLLFWRRHQSACILAPSAD